MIGFMIRVMPLVWMIWIIPIHVAIPMPRIYITLFRRSNIIRSTIVPIVILSSRRRRRRTCRIIHRHGIMSLSMIIRWIPHVDQPENMPWPHWNDSTSPGYNKLGRRRSFYGPMPIHRPRSQRHCRTHHHHQGIWPDWPILGTLPA